MNGSLIMSSCLVLLLARVLFLGKTIRSSRCIQTIWAEHIDKWKRMCVHNESLFHRETHVICSNTSCNCRCWWYQKMFIVVLEINCWSIYRRIYRNSMRMEERLLSRLNKIGRKDVLLASYSISNIYENLFCSDLLSNSHW